MKQYVLKKKFLYLGIIITIICFMIIAIFHEELFFSCILERGPCNGAKSDAANIKSAISYYFEENNALPEPNDVSEYILTYNDNPWTFFESGDEIIIIVYDIKQECPDEKKKTDPDWSSDFLIKRVSIESITAKK